MKCPNKQSPAWIKLVDTIGPREAYREFLTHDDIPDASQYDGSWQQQVWRAVTNFKLKPVVKNNVYGYTTSNDKITPKLVDTMNKWFQDNGKYPDLGVYYDKGNPVLQFGRRKQKQQELYYQQPIKQLKHELQSSIIKGERGTSKDDTLQAALNYFRAEDESGRTGQEDVQRQELFSSYLKKNGLIYNKSLPNKELSKGNEQTVYIGENQKVVIKANKGNHFPNWKEYLKNIIIHNKLFPATQYKLLGFVEKSPFEILAIVEQPYVESNSSTPISQEEKDKYMNEMGFERYGTGEKSLYNYYNKDLGVHIDDLHDRNILKRDGELFFIDTNNWVDSTFYESSDEYNQLLSESIEKPDTNITNKIRSFIESLGGTIQYVPEIVIDGQVIDANAVADVISRTIQVADSKEQVDTLPEEAAHIYVQWLPANSRLLNEMMRDIKNRPEYEQVLREYGKNSQYQNADGSINTDKIAKEAIGKVIARAIVEQGTKDKKAQNWWNRLWTWVKGLFSGKDWDNYRVAASDILEGNTSSLDMNAIREANSRGEYYYQLPEEQDKYLSKILKDATPEQKKAVELLITNPQNRVVLDADSHVYEDMQGNQYRSTTQLINGEFEGNSEEYEINRQWGNDMDNILQAVITRKGMSEVSTPTMTDAIKEEAYLDMATFIGQLTADGSIPLTQVVIATPYDPDPNKRTAGSIDLLLVKSNGDMRVVDLKTSWHSVKSSAYKRAYPVGEDSALVDDAGRPMNMSRTSKYITQVNSYGKMLEMAGFNVTQTTIKNIHVQQENGVMTGYADEGIRNNDPDTNKAWVDKIVPGEVTGKRVIESANPLHENRDAEKDLEYSEEVMANMKEQLQTRVTELYQATKSWKDTLDTLRNNSAFKFGDQTRQNIDELIRTLDGLKDNPEKMGEAYTVFLSATRRQLNAIIDYLSKREGDKLVNAERSQEYLWVTSMAAQYLNTYQGLYHTEEFPLTISQERLYKQVDKLLRQTGQAIINGQRYVADKQIGDWSVNQAVKNEIFKSGFDSKGNYISGYELEKDITGAQEWAGSLGGNTPLDIIQKKWTHATEKAREQTDIQVDQLNDVANRLIKIQGNDDYSWMHQTDSNGRWTGKIVNNISSTYSELRQEVYAPLYDVVDGTKKYIPVVDTINGNQDHIEWNKDLWYKRQAYNRFMEAESAEEVESGVWNIADGKYHRYSDEFKTQRDIYMISDISKYGTIKWRFRNLNQISEDTKNKLKERHPEKTLKQAWEYECLKWRDENYTYQPRLKIIVDKKGKPTGLTDMREGDDAWIPMQEHVRIREEASDGTILMDSKYMKLMDPVTEIDQVRSEYYKKYMDIMKKCVEPLPNNAEYWMTSGNVPVLPANIMQQLSERGANYMTIMAKYLKPQLVPKNRLDKDIISKKEIPVAFMNSVQDVNRLQMLNNEIQELSTKKDSMSEDTYNKRYDKLKELIDIENNKIKPEELNKDMTLGLGAFVKMSERYRAQVEIEQELLNLKDKVAKMTFEQKITGLTGKVTKTVEGVESHTYKMLDWWMDNEFYHDSAFTKTMADYIVNKLMNVTSGSVISFNFSGMVKNATIASFNNTIESLGGDFFGRKEYKEAVKEYHTDYITGVAKTIGEQGKKYGEKKAGSKYEALVRHFNMVKHSQDETTGRVDWLNKLWGYKGYDAGEYMVQSEVGIAITKTVKVKDKDGNEISLYDAYEFNPNSGEISLKEGVTIDDKLKRDTTHRIWKTNERIHGNYRWKVQLEKYAVGRLVLQFHKWVWPNFKQRFEGQRFDETLGGGMDIEGRYTTLWNFLRSIKGVTDIVDGKGWEKLTQFQKNNMKKNLADILYVSALIAIGYIVKKASSGLDPEEDPYLRKMTNWLQYEADAGAQEMSIFIPGFNVLESYRMIQNPVAVTGSIKKFVNVLYDASHMPFQDTEKWYYQRGIYSGELKLAKHTRDLIPLLRSYNAWVSFDQVNNFYIP